MSRSSSTKKNPAVPDSSICRSMDAAVVYNSHQNEFLEASETKQARNRITLRVKFF